MRRKKSTVIQLLEFVPVYLAFQCGRAIPLWLAHWISWLLGGLIFNALPRQRRVAVTNLRHVFGQTKSAREIKAIARQSCRSLIGSWFETMRLVALLGQREGRKTVLEATEGLEALFQKARELHESFKGCIFVTPHIGNWEFFPYISACAGIPVVVVVRPLDNRFLEKWLYAHRQASGQIIVPKTNSMFFLQNALRRGKSIGMLPDQSTMKAISVDYLGRKASTTPVPAMLAVLYNRPIVVVACCRQSKDFRYEGFVSDPIVPQPESPERDEIFRLTEMMNREMGAIIKRYPEQYLWMHDRWKRYRYKKEMLLK
jgi:Kdo2-lipid IVA lauroyltransferase/acyltransferase